VFEDVTIHTPKNLAYRLRQITCSLPETSSDLTPEKYNEFFTIASREYFRAAIEAANGNVSEIANKIGVGRTTVFRRIQELGLRAEKKVAARNHHSHFYSQPVGREKRSEI
jgi:DNA-binding NtrC family response regulator